MVSNSYKKKKKILRNVCTKTVFNLGGCVETLLISKVQIKSLF